ncbi:MAG: DUF4410 domain-containing protein [Candidatus Acidiferrales bacterium]
MPNRQPAGSPGGYSGGAQPGPPNIPDTPAPPAEPERSQRIYVTDFELDSVGATPAAGGSPKANASEARAQHLVKLMSDNLLKDFAKAGYTTKLLRPSDPRPDDGFLVAGVFAQVDADNRLHRAAIGSGQSAETLQLYVAVRDLAHFTPPLYQADPADSSGSKPGAVIEINQNADALKFSIEADITDKDIKQTAQRISAELVKRINAAVKSEDEQLNKYAKP